MESLDRRIEHLVSEFLRKVSELARAEATRVETGRRIGIAPRRRRSPAANARLKARVLAYVARHPGARVADINTGLGTITQDVAKPIRALIHAKKLRTAGVTRGMRYYLVESTGSSTRRPRRAN